MANENTYSDAADLRVAAALTNRGLLDLNFDPTALRSRLYFIPHPLNGTLAVKQPLIQRSYAASAPGEDTAGSNIAIVDSSATLTPARRQWKFYQTDLTVLTAPQGSIDPDALANIINQNVEFDYTDLACTAGATATTNVGGGGGVDMSVDDLYDGIFALNLALNAGGLTAVLAPNSYNEFIGSLRGETGALQYMAETAAMLNSRGLGYKGTILGVDIVQADSVVEDTNVNQNFIFAPGAIGYTYAAVGRVLPYVDRSIARSDAMSFVTIAWDDDKSSARIVGQHYPAVAVLDQSKMAGITTDDV